jgi:hypothetical protein
MQITSNTGEATDPVQVIVRVVGVAACVADTLVVVGCSGIARHATPAPHVFAGKFNVRDVDGVDDPVTSVAKSSSGVCGLPAPSRALESGQRRVCAAFAGAAARASARRSQCACFMTFYLS